MNWTFPEVFELAAAKFSERPALVNAGLVRTWREYDERAARIAAFLDGGGLAPGAKAAIYGYNSNEYLEAQYGMFKARVTSVNVNYRYVEHELIYLLDNADAEAVFFDAQFAPRLAAIRDRLPKLRLFVEIDDGSDNHLEGATEFEEVIAGSDPSPRRAYSEDDIYMLYTGGTTGMPKGVMYRHGDFVQGLGQSLIGPDAPPTLESLAAVMDAAAVAGLTPVSCPACPLMHGTGLWLGVFLAHFLGGAAVTFRNRHFDPRDLWRLVEAERVTSIAIVGDAFAKPMLEALREARAAGWTYDISSLRTIISSGVMFSAEVKAGLLEFADIEIRDGMGATEGSMGSNIVSRAAPPGPTAKFVANSTTKVFNERDEEVLPGSGEVGMIANGGFTPIGYYKDPEKSARTFRVINGHRYSFPGDFATVAADGSLVLLGRGSVCINTGGEKVYPEEVEEALKADPAVWDALVVGLPDERFGERVTAVVALRPGHDWDETSVLETARAQIAGYKVPRQLFLVDEVRRAPNGKADYKWARETAVRLQAEDAS